MDRVLRIGTVPTTSHLPLTFDQMLARMYASDRSADGLFITGVVTTGIYCLPSCPARKPKAENVVFYGTEEEAQAVGLRACKRCRPDDFYGGRDSDRERLQATLDALELDPSAFPDVAALASHMGVGLSKLHKLALRCFETPPGELLHDTRIGIAKRLLREGSLGPTEVAFTVGYGSVSAFYARFKNATGMTPGSYARSEESASRPGL